MTSSSARLPLAGIRVLDLSRILAGPFCTMLLGDLGAEVIKVEHVKGGDDTRSWGPPFAVTEAGKESAYFLGVNRNKKSLAVDLKTQEGQKLVQDLAAVSDIVVENYVPGKTAKLGVSYEHLKPRNDKLIYASLTGFGSTGPRSTQLAYDVMISALGGLMGITGNAATTPEEQEYCKVGVAITDICTGLVLQGAIMAALVHVLRGGEGQAIETSLLDTQVAALANVASAYLVSGVVTKPQGTGHVSIVPYQAFPCKGGESVIVGALNDGQFRRLCDALSLSDLGEDARFKTNAVRVANRKELIPLLEAAMLQHDVPSILDLLASHDVPSAPINPVNKVFEDPQVVHNKRVVSVEHPTVGLLKMVANPATFHGTPLTTLKPPPLHGEHTATILQDLLKLSPEQIKELSAKRVIHTH